MAKLTLAAVKTLIEGQTTILMTEIQTLKDEVAALKTELAAVKPPEQSTQKNNPAAEKIIICDAVKASMNAALEEEKIKKEVVILQLPEKNMDANDVSELCENVKPEGLMRLGKVNKDRPRPLKVTFPTSFDARAFISKIEQARESNPEGFKIYCRPGRTREQQALSTKIYQMNKKAKRGESYSVMKNGDVLKHKQEDAGKWVRVTDWTLSSISQENETGSSSSSSSLSQNLLDSLPTAPSSLQGNGRNAPTGETDSSSSSSPDSQNPSDSLNAAPSSHQGNGGSTPSPKLS